MAIVRTEGEARVRRVRRGRALLVEGRVEVVVSAGDRRVGGLPRRIGVGGGSQASYTTAWEGMAGLQALVARRLDKGEVREARKLLAENVTELERLSAIVRGEVADVVGEPLGVLYWVGVPCQTWDKWGEQRTMVYSTGEEDMFTVVRGKGTEIGVVKLEVEEGGGDEDGEIVRDSDMWGDFSTEYIEALEDEYRMDADVDDDEVDGDDVYAAWARGDIGNDDALRRMGYGRDEDGGEEEARRNTGVEIVLPGPVYDVVGRVVEERDVLLVPQLEGFSEEMGTCNGWRQGKCGGLRLPELSTGVAGGYNTLSACAAVKMSWENWGNLDLWLYSGGEWRGEEWSVDMHGIVEKYAEWMAKAHEEEVVEGKRGAMEVLERIGALEVGVWREGMAVWGVKVARMGGAGMYRWKALVDGGPEVCVKVVATGGDSGKAWRVRVGATMPEMPNGVLVNPFYGRSREFPVAVIQTVTGALTEEEMGKVLGQCAEVLRVWWPYGEAYRDIVVSPVAGGGEASEATAAEEKARRRAAQAEAIRPAQEALDRVSTAEASLDTLMEAVGRTAAEARAAGNDDGLQDALDRAMARRNLWDAGRITDVEVAHAEAIGRNVAYDQLRQP